MGLQSINASPGGEEQQIAVRGCLNQMSESVFILELGAGDAAATTTLRTELFGGRRLYIARCRHREDKRIVIDQIFDVELTRVDLE